MVEGRGRAASNLKQALREVRIAHAEREDVVVEMREAEQARLKLLSDSLEGVFADLPPNHEQLLVGLLPGRPPRFWVDATSFVVMGADKRQYQLCKDTRLGRTVLAESPSVETIADAVTRYVAERIVERERAVEADWLTTAIRGERAGGAGVRRGGDTHALIWGLAGFALGAVAGMFLLLAYAWFMVG